MHAPPQMEHGHYGPNPLGCNRRQPQEHGVGRPMQNHESYARLAANHAQSWEIQATYTVQGMSLHPLMKTAIAEGKAQLFERAKSSRIKKEVMEKFMQCIECGIAGQEAPIPKFIPELREAMRDQNTIGTSKLLQGYMARSWVTAMKRAEVKRPHQCAKTLQRLLWDILFQ